MPESYGQRAMNQRQHIPQNIERAMNQHMQQTMPAHLRKYMDGSISYVPQAAQKQISQYMERSMPAHMKQYAGAYMEQKVAMTNTARPNIGGASRQIFQPAPMPDKMRLEHNRPAQQYSVDPGAMPSHAANLFRSDGTPPPPLQPQQQPTTPVGPLQPDYSFITDPNQPKPKKSLLPTGSSGPMRALIIGALLVVLMVVFVVVKGLLAGGSGNYDGYVSVEEDQQALIHILNSAVQQQNLNNTNQNFVATATLSLNSSQQDLSAYLSQNHKKITSKQQVSKISASTDSQLSDAATAGTYNQTLHDVMKTKLNSYLNDLSAAYKQSTGKKGRALLSSDYDQGQLLLQQLDAPGS